MDADILKIDANSWSECCKYIKSNFDLLTEKERPAFEFLEKQWKEVYNSRVCEQFILVLSKEDAKHGNNKELKEKLGTFRGLCKKYYTKEERRFDEFKAVLTSLGVSVGINSMEQPSHNTGSTPNSQYSQTSRVSRVDLILDSGNRYIGEIMNDLPNGKGTMIYTNGCRYEGEWSNGEWSGRGVFTDVSGRIDSGEFRHNVRTGSGRIVLPDGSRYEGGWNDEGPHGVGTFYHNDKSKYSGEWYNGKQHGNGVLTTSDGQKKKVRFNAGVLVNEITETMPRTTSSATYSRTTVESTSTYYPQKSSKIKYFMAFIALLILCSCIYYFWYTPYATDRDAPRYYTFTNLNLRSSQIADVEYNLLGLLPYGTELITYSVGDEWADVKAHGKKGFVASSLVLPSEDFHLLNSAWGNSDAKECIATAKCRLAVLDYYKRCNLKGGIEWQVYTKKKEDRQNNVFFPRVCDRNSKFTDFAFIVKNNQTQKRMFALYSFDDETEAPVFRYDMEAPEEGYIKNIESYRNYSSLRLVVSYSNGRRQTATLNNVAPTQPSRPVQPSVSSSQHTSPAPAVNKMSAQELNQQGDIYYEKKEYQQAISYYKKAAENGYSEAFANLGWIYYRGLGVPVDGAIAISYLKDAMAMGNLNAGFYLGLLYEHGIGNRFYDMDKALAAYKQAAYGGHEKAIESLKRLADNGNRFACLYIATLYKDGVANGDFQNKEQAVHYYRLAAEKGMDEAINALKELNVESN